MEVLLLGLREHISAEQVHLTLIVLFHILGTKPADSSEASTAEKVAPEKEKMLNARRALAERLKREVIGKKK